MARNEFDAHRHWGATGNRWAPVCAVKRGLALGTVVGAAGGAGGCCRRAERVWVGVMGNRLLTLAEFRKACGDALARVKANAVERGDFELAAVIAGPCAQPSDRDRQWIARNLGDVPMRIIDADSVPVESLGRDA